MNNCFFGHLHTKKRIAIFFSPPVSILDTRYRTVLFRKLADAFLMMYQTAAVGIFTNIGTFGGFHHGNPVSLERVQSDNFGIEKARKRQPSARGFGGNVEIFLWLRPFPDFGDLLPIAPMMIDELMLF